MELSSASAHPFLLGGSGHRPALAPPRPWLDDEEEEEEEEEEEMEAEQVTPAQASEQEVGQEEDAAEPLDPFLASSSIPAARAMPPLPTVTRPLHASPAASMPLLPPYGRSVGRYFHGRDWTNVQVGVWVWVGPCDRGTW